MVEHDGDVYVRACPGAGKTRTTLALAARVSAGLGPRRGVMLLSFTNAACDELRERLAAYDLARLVRAPNYVGTFDSFVMRFVIRPHGSPWAERGQRTMFLESWTGFGDIRFRAPDLKPQTMGVPLDTFRLASDGRIQLDLRLARNPVLRGWLGRLTPAQVVKLTATAEANLGALKKRGFLTPAFARQAARERLDHERSGPPIREALGARFALALVDEAQDSDATDLTIVQHLRAAKVSCVLVADPEQSIFRWRGARPQELTALGLPELSLTGNFRSTRTVCAVAASLRATTGPPDDVRAPHATEQRPAILYAYSKTTMGFVGQHFVRQLSSLRIDPAYAVALSHQEKFAQMACGRSGEAGERSTNARKLARALAPDVDARSRTCALDVLERALLKSVGATDETAGALPASTQRWVRFTSRQLLGQLQACQPAEGAVCKTMRKLLARVVPPSGVTFVKKPSATFHAKDGGKSTTPSIEAADGLRISTIHAAKGREFDAVLIVLPDDKRTDELIEAWQQRNPEHEGRAVIYVAATRAKRLLAIAGPARLTDKVRMLMERQGGEVQICHIEAPRSH